MGLSHYAFAYRVIDEGDEVSFKFAKLPHLISVHRKGDVENLGQDELEALLHDAVTTGLQALISSKFGIPETDSPDIVEADGFVYLDSVEAMKLELYRVYRENCLNPQDLARKIGKQETAARRLLNLQHRSRPSEVEAAIACFGKRLRHSWSVENRPARKLALT